MKFLMPCFLLMVCTAAFGQTGTYLLKTKGGASCRIAAVKDGDQLSCEVFAWWAGASGRNGNFAGLGKLTGTNYLLKSADDPDCRVTLVFEGQILKASFGDCMGSNLPEDFSGTYQKIAAQVPGSYIVKATKAYFYKTANTSSRKNSYLVRGDVVEVDLENITGGSWVLINYSGKKGNRTTGYLKWADLKAN